MKGITVPGKIVAFTHCGKVRSGNEDALYVGGKIIQGNDESLHTTLQDHDILLLAGDGMGGHERGEIASIIVVEAVSSLLDPYRPFDLPSVEEAIAWASERIRGYVAQHAEAAGMGSTLAGLWIRNQQGLVFNVGDSRVYVYENNRLESLTRDHSLIWVRVESGEITEEEARTAPGKNQLSSAITDSIDPLEHGYFVRAVHVHKGSVFLLCSDGLWETMSREEMEGLFAVAPNIEVLCERLKQRVLSTQARDNLSLILLQTE
jgi:PPM family protein phosphatase